MRPPGVQTTRVRVGASATSDNTSWSVLFARPVFQSGDRVLIRRFLSVIATALILDVGGNISTDAALILELQAASSAHEALPLLLRGDVVEYVSNTCVLPGCSFC